MSLRMAFQPGDRFGKLVLVIPGPPRTKKNSQRMARRKDGSRFPLPSKAYEDYQEMAGLYIPQSARVSLSVPLNVKGVYYMPTRRRVDLVNLLEATCDILVHYHVVKDDNSKIVAGHDGSRVLWDKSNPRAEIEIEAIE